MSKEIDKTKIITAIISGFFGLLTSAIPILLNNLTKKEVVVVQAPVEEAPEVERTERQLENKDGDEVIIPYSEEPREIETTGAVLVRDEILTPINVVIIVSAIGIAIVLGLTILKRIRRRK